MPRLMRMWTGPKAFRDLDLTRWDSDDVDIVPMNTVLSSETAEQKGQRRTSLMSIPAARVNSNHSRSSRATKQSIGSCLSCLHQASSGMRADMTQEDSSQVFDLDNLDRMAQQMHSKTGGQSRKSLRVQDMTRLRSLAAKLTVFLRSNATEYILQALAVVSLFVEPFLLAIEPACDIHWQRRVIIVIKLVNCTGSFFYSMTAFGEMCVRVKMPARSLLQCCRGGGVGPASEEGEGTLGFDWLLLDQFGLLGLIADFMHIFEQPHDTPTWLQCLCMINLLKGWRWFIGSKLHRRMPSFWTKMMHLFFSIFLVTHIYACVFALVALIEADDGLPTWADPDLLQQPRSCRDFYFTMFYFSAYTITSVGHGDIVPVSLVERVVDSMVMLVSTMYVTKAFRELIFHISTRNYWQAQKQRRVTQTLAALRGMHAPAALCERVLWYQHFIWELRTERRSQECLRDLSEIARFEIKSLMYHELVHTASCLQLLPIGALRYIVTVLTDSNYLPSDFIVRRGDEASRLYFLREGTAGVFVSQGVPTWYDQEVKTLTDGDSFGELGMLTAQKRTAWIMARSFCVASSLTKAVMDEVVAADPSCMVLLAKSMQKALSLTATLTWPEVAALFLKRFGTVTDIFHYMGRQHSEGDAEPGLVTFTRYEQLMSSVQVTVLDQKLLWIDVDTDRVGHVPFMAFVGIAFSGSSSALAEAEAVAPGEEAATEALWMLHLGAKGAEEKKLKASLEEPARCRSPECPESLVTRHGSKCSKDSSEGLARPSQQANKRESTMSNASNGTPSSSASPNVTPSNSGSPGNLQQLKSFASTVPASAARNAQLGPSSKGLPRVQTLGESAFGPQDLLTKIDLTTNEISNQLKCHVARLASRLDELEQCALDELLASDNELISSDIAEEDELPDN